jgi:outer membrane protein assembly factor BamE (lipoprotein component of BamABCDE complex)
MFKLINPAKVLGLVSTLILLAGCSATYKNHGYVPSDSDLAELVEGVDIKATVDDVIGPPTSAGLMAGGDYYYVRSRVRTFGMFRPEVVERQILAISFDETDTIRNIERFGLEDGKTVALSRRVTDSSVEDNTFWRQVIGNIGNISPEDLF